MCLEENCKYVVNTLMTTTPVISFLNIKVPLWGDGGDFLVPIPQSILGLLAILVVADYKLPWPCPGSLSQKASLDLAPPAPPVVL